MKNKLKYIVLIVMVSLISFNFSGCGIIDKGLIKFGFMNSDFEYLNENKVEKIVIQNTRDKGFRFIVTEPIAIKEIYETLRDGNPTSSKTNLEPDYVFEMHVGGEVKKYSYVVGVNERNQGNFYDENNAYSVPKNLDQTIIQNLSFIRKPREFEDIYYNSILKILEMKKDEYKNGDYKVGIDILNDVDCLKYMFSVDLQAFEMQLKKLVPNVQFVNSNPEDFDVVISVKNRGFNSKSFKSLITVDNKKDKKYEKLYVTGEYGFNSWDITVDEKKPDEW